MTKEEMLAEKIDAQKELLAFEAENGRPVGWIYKTFNIYFDDLIINNFSKHD